jgi:predicted DNA-binding transcriptional regulator AlpA
MEDLTKLVTAEQYAEWRGITKNAAAAERYNGNGPKFVKAGRRVYYRVADVNEWLEQNIHTMTGEAA